MGRPRPPRDPIDEVGECHEVCAAASARSHSASVSCTWVTRKELPDQTLQLTLGRERQRTAVQQRTGLSYDHAGTGARLNINDEAYPARMTATINYCPGLLD